MADNNQQQQQQAGRTAFNWHVYSNRRSALLYLRKSHTLADIILETEDGSASELVHSQVMSAFGDKLSDYIKKNGHYQPPPACNPATVGGGTGTGTGTSSRIPEPSGSSEAAIEQQQQVVWRQGTAGSVWQLREPAERVKSIRLPKLNRYTLHILVECAYTGSICTDLHSGGIWQILELADHYEMHDVLRACCNFLTKNLNQNNCIQFYHVGLKHKHPLMRNAWHTIRANFKHILAENLLQLHLDPATMEPMQAGAPVNESGGYNCWLATMLFEHYQELLMHDKLNVEREESVWFAIKLWCQFPALLINQQLRLSTLPASTSPALTSTATETAGKISAITEPATNSGNATNDETTREDTNNKQRGLRVTELLPCMRFPRFRTGTEFSTRRIWRDPLIFSNKQAQHQLAVLDRNHRDFLSSSSTFQQAPHPPSSSSHSAAAGGSSATASDAPLATSNSSLTYTGATVNSNNGNNYHYYHNSRDGFGLPCAVHPRQLRPRIPHSILLAIGGWQQGQPTKLIESYDLNCNLWFESKHKIMFPLAYHGIESVYGILYICGGTNGNDILNEVFTFSPLTGDCRQLASMREARCYVSTAYLDGFLYAMGGHNGLQRVKSAERFQIGGQPTGGANSSPVPAPPGQWTHVQDMQVARSDGSACVHGGRIYIAGGLNDQVIESSVEFYNQLDNTWTFIASMITPRTSFTLLAYPADNCLLAIGGNDGSERLNSVERFHFSPAPSSNQASAGTGSGAWSVHSQMRHRRSTFSACLLERTKLIVVGGYNGQTPFNQVEMFDRQVGEWVLLKKMRFDRSGLKVVSVENMPNASEYTYLGNVQ